ncbi:MAG: D-amino-acid oxidase [Thermoplasmata archaeon]|nr:D-amino-acid oxidase [Thermoplasmata archaeon]
MVGAGVVGLSCALKLQEAGRRVTIRAEARTPRTTSDVAAAYFYPSRMAPDPRILRWGLATRARLAELAKDPGSGVRPAEALHLARPGAETPWWAPVMEGFRAARPDELPPGHAAGWMARTFVAEMPVYLRHLERAFEAAGGAFEAGHVADVQALAREDGRLVVNCTGLGAREAARDETMYPIRGQVVRVENAGLARIVSDPATMSYVVPRSRDVVLGGTAQEGDWRLHPDAATEADILRRCAALVPGVAQARVTGRAVGLRPGRPTVRLEREGRVVHCYGHGGSGMTLSWGCADEVADLA